MTLLLQISFIGSISLFPTKLGSEDFSRYLFRFSIYNCLLQMASFRLCFEHFQTRRQSWQSGFRITAINKIPFSYFSRASNINQIKFDNCRRGNWFRLWQHFQCALTLSIEWVLLNNEQAIKGSDLRRIQNCMTVSIFVKFYIIRRIMYLVICGREALCNTEIGF